MDIEGANAFVRVVSDNFSFYPEETQRRLLDGIFQLADECKADLAERFGADNYAEIQTKLGMAKLFVSEALKKGNLAQGFREAEQCFWPNSLTPQKTA